MTTTGEERPGAALVEVVFGVDTHLDVHAAVALDHLGRRLGMVTLPTTEKGSTSDSSRGHRLSAP